MKKYFLLIFFTLNYCSTVNDSLMTGSMTAKMTNTENKDEFMVEGYVFERFIADGGTNTLQIITRSSNKYLVITSTGRPDRIFNKDDMYVQRVNNSFLLLRKRLSIEYFSFYLKNPITDNRISAENIQSISFDSCFHPQIDFTIRTRAIGEASIDTVYMNSEYGFFIGQEASIQDNKQRIVIHTSRENLKNFRLNQLSIAVDVQTQRAVPSILEDTPDKKTVLVQALGLNWTIKEYIVEIIYNKDSYDHEYHKNFLNKIKDKDWILNGPYYSGQILENGTIIRLSKKGHRSDIDESGYYEYHFVRAYDNYKAIYKNSRTGIYILVHANDNSNISLIPPYGASSYYIVDNGANIAGIVGDVIVGASLALANIISGNIPAAIGLGGAFFANAIITGVNSQNLPLTLNYATSSGYMLHQFEPNIKYYWGTAYNYWEIDRNY